jgi:hypothetical protein
MAERDQSARATWRNRADASQGPGGRSGLNCSQQRSRSTSPPLLPSTAVPLPDSSDLRIWALRLGETRKRLAALHLDIDDTTSSHWGPAWAFRGRGVCGKGSRIDPRGTM